MKRLGLIVNPVAGMGGKVGLKGTDGAEIPRIARSMGATQISPERGRRALKRISKINDTLEILTCSGMMGENIARDEGFKLKVVCEVEDVTTASDTKRCAGILRDEGVDLLIFVGGDGTARDICETVGDTITVLGVPSGVKMYSSCFGITPEAAGDLALLHLTREGPKTSLAEVLDVDEEMFRRGVLSTRLYCYLRVPHEASLTQHPKVATQLDSERAQQEAIAEQVIENIEPGHYYIIGPGTTTKEIMKKLGFESNPLGIDIVRVREDGRAELVGTDLNEESIYRIVSGIGKGEAGLIITPLGGQGFIFGRGNQQLSPRIIELIGREGISIVATQNKVASIAQNGMLIDTGSPETDKRLSGYYRVITGYRLFSILEAKTWH
ncbi:MAG: ATP-NAD kinase family protein [Thermoplasmata archaeon]